MAGRRAARAGLARVAPRGWRALARDRSVRGRPDHGRRDFDVRGVPFTLKVGGDIRNKVRDLRGPGGNLETYTYVGPDGKRRTRKVWHMLLQVPNHQTDHRSQVATILGSMGLEVPQTDLVAFLSERSA